DASTADILPHAPNAPAFVDAHWNQIFTGNGFASVNQITTSFATRAVMAYGGRRGGIANAEVLYAASQSQGFRRTTAGGTLTQTTSQPLIPGNPPAPAGTIIDIVLDPNDWMTVYVTDGA